jgi:hypothetical protein
MNRPQLPRSRVERIAPALDFALVALCALSLALSAWPSLTPIGARPRVSIQCSPTFDCAVSLARRGGGHE